VALAGARLVAQAAERDAARPGRPRRRRPPAVSRRVLVPGGLFYACTRARTSDPELTEGYPPPTIFDAEDAPQLVATVFGDDAVEVTSWDAPLLRLPDQEAIRRYARTHYLPADLADRMTAPLAVTKRGCLVTAVNRPGGVSQAAEHRLRVPGVVGMDPW
jgi:hypothetical protein